ncbi:MAG TPA: hypothetical protein VM686_33565, partial [Polyangiaceae bacterium]|nr:hypothetical protein [Polyangiaceae bacterium]
WVWGPGKWKVKKGVKYWDTAVTLAIEKTSPYVALEKDECVSVFMGAIDKELAGDPYTKAERVFNESVYCFDGTSLKLQSGPNGYARLSDGWKFEAELNWEMTTRSCTP